MKFEDYKIEDMTFTTKVNWTDEEKAEALATFPETKDIEKVEETCNRINDDIANGTIKTTAYYDINKSSAKAYAKKHSDCFYGRSNNLYYSSDENFYIIVDGDKRIISNSYTIERILEYCKNIERRFENLKHQYSEKEKKAEEERTKESYTTANESRINANKTAYALLEAIHIEIPIDLDNTRYRLETTKKSLKDLELWHNRYGEMTKGDKIISEQTANELSKMAWELSKELSDIIDIYNGRYKDIIRKNAQ